MKMINELSLFTGAGGGIWGSKLLGWRTVGYVEIDNDCQRVIAQRIKDEIFDRAPIYGDIKAFAKEGFAASYTGLVDIITAGFPCQPFSKAGVWKGESDERNLWPQTLECIRIIRPRQILLENVAEILKDPYIRRIFFDLATCGYYIRWDCIHATACGADHQRDRLWILADANGQRRRSFKNIRCGSKAEWFDISAIQERRKNWRIHQPGLVRTMSNDVSRRRNRIMSLGNAQVPRVVKAAWEFLNDE